ncbi:MAG: Spy/CpxP family protein refolding chaperone [Thermoanaerobaculia bacterium]
MKRISIPILLLTLIAVAAVAAPGPGRGPGGGPGAGPGGPQGQQQGPGEILPPPLLAEFLGLTEAQIAQIQPLRGTLRATVEPLAEQQRANQEQLRAAVDAGNAAQAGQLLITNHGLGQQIRAAHDTFKAAFEALLTSEQKAKWDVYQEISELRRSPRE